MFDFEDILASSIVNWISVIVPGQRVFVLYLFTALIMGMISYLYFKVRSNNKNGPDVSGGATRYLFGNNAYTHKSARQDYKYFWGCPR